MSGAYLGEWIPGKSALPSPWAEGTKLLSVERLTPSGTSLGLTGFSDRTQRQCPWAALGWPPNAQQERHLFPVSSRWGQKKSLGLAGSHAGPWIHHVAGGMPPIIDNCCSSDPKTPFSSPFGNSYQISLGDPFCPHSPGLSETANLYTPPLGPRQEHLS